VNTRTASSIGLVLGTVFILMGVGTSTSSLWMLGGIILAIGIVSSPKKSSNGS
jgi:hypothetical protein